tara:strand:+ start:54 stop:503 length:450 start_codon:yes stop_codon:yes gene_type:complete
MMGPIECKLRTLSEKSGKPKVGHYLRTWYSNAPGLGTKTFAVGLRVEVNNLDELLAQEHNPEEIALGCIEFLNIIKQPKRGRRKKNPPYGNLQLYFNKIPSWERPPGRKRIKEEGRVRVQEDEEGKYLAIVALTDNRKVKTFSGTALKR